MRDWSSHVDQNDVIFEWFSRDVDRNLSNRKFYITGAANFYIETYRASQIQNNILSIFKSLFIRAMKRTCDKMLDF